MSMILPPLRTHKGRPSGSCAGAPALPSATSVWDGRDFSVQKSVSLHDVSMNVPVSPYLADGLINGGSPLDSLSVVMGDIGPPICLSFDVAENHIFDRSRHARNLWIQHLNMRINMLSTIDYLPWNIGFPASPTLWEMLQDCAGLVSLDTLELYVMYLQWRSIIIEYLKL